MKFRLRFFTPLMVWSLASPLIATSPDAPSSEPQLEEIQRATKLNSILEKELLHLEEINSTLQYLGQALNKGSIKVSNIENTRDWIRQHQKLVSGLQTQCTTEPPTEVSLRHGLVTVKFLAIHITETINEKFKPETLIHFDIPPVTKEPSTTPSLDALNAFSQSNNQVITELRARAKDAGLTDLNRFARKLDDINNKYHITTIVENIPLVTALAGGALYFTPKDWLKDIPVIKTVKKWLGDHWTDNSPLSAKERLDDIKAKKDALNDNKVNVGEQVFKERMDRLNLDEVELNTQINRDKSRTGWYSKGVKLVENNRKLLKTILEVGVPLLLLKKESIPGYMATKQTLRNQWNKLKGYEVEQRDSTSHDHITLDDPRLVGLDGQIDELRNLVRYVTDPEMYDRTNTSLEKGILLVGPSRCGKTFLARALRDTINDALEAKGIGTKYGFKEVKWSEIVWDSEGLKSVIDEAKFNAPCVVFIDEIHNLPLQTKEGGNVLTQFLTGMSGINSENDARHQVILLGATNQPEKLDTALLQPGRFGTIIRFEKPNYHNRKKYFDIIFKYNVIDTSSLDIDALARQTQGCSYGDLETIVKNARFVARTLARSVSQEHLQNRIDQHVYRLKNALPLSIEERKLISAHLAGHALLHVLLDIPEKVELVTIRGRWNTIKEIRYWEKSQHLLYKQEQSKYGKLFTYNDAEVLNVETKTHKEMLCKVALAGSIAEEILLGSTGYSYHPQDKQKALKYAKEIAFDGMLEKDLPKSVQKELHQEAYKLVKRYEQEVRELLTQQKVLLEKIAQELETHTNLRASELQALVQEYRK